MRVTYILLGWLLGVLSPVIVDGIRSRRQLRDAKKGIRLELDLLCYRMAHVAYDLATRANAWDRDFLESLIPALELGPRVALESRMLEAVRGLLAYSDADLAVAAVAATPPTGTSVTLRRYELPFLTAQLSLLPRLPVASQRQLLEIRTQLGNFNEVVGEVHELNVMTFHDLSAVNRKAVDANLDRAYKNALDRCKIVMRLCLAADLQPSWLGG